MTEALEKQVAEHTGQIGTISAEVHALGRRMGGMEDALVDLGKETRESFEKLQRNFSKSQTPVWPLWTIVTALFLSIAGVVFNHMLSTGHAGVSQNASDITNMDISLQREIQLEVARSNDAIEDLDAGFQRELSLEIKRIDGNVSSLDAHMTIHDDHWKEQWQRQ